MKVTFLDINGVLNSWDYHYHRRVRAEGKESFLDPMAIERLNRLLDATDAEIVLTSTLRRGRMLQEMRDAFRLRGVRKTIMTGTPDLSATHPRAEGRRGAEIQAYLDTYGRAVSSFVILDDNDEMGQRLRPHLVQTNFQDGLTDAHVDAAIRLLNASEPVR